MNEKQIKQALQEIAATHITEEVDLWPQIERKVARSPRFPVWEWGLRLAGTAAAVVILFLFATWFLSLRQPITTGEVTLQGNTPSAPAPFSFTINTELVYPAAPTALPQYRVAVTEPPQTEEAMLAWANEFGLPNPKLFHDPRSPELMLAVGDDDSRLIFPAPGQALGGISYLRSDWLDLPAGETISFDDAAAVAQTFLDQHQQLPPDFQIVDHISAYFNADGYPLRLLQVTPGLNGYPVLQSAADGIGATLHVDAAGTVISAGFAEGTFIEADRVNVRPAEEVLTDFINGRITPLAQEYMPAYAGWGDVEQYHPPLRTHTIGEQVTILETDDTHFLVAEDGSKIRATLATRTGEKYQLVTPNLAEIVDSIGYSELRVTGTIVAQVAPDTWRLVVDTWEILPQQAISSGCAIGPVTIDASGAWVTAESALSAVVVDGRYTLENLPATIQNGDRIEVCGEPLPAVGGILPWSIIYRPPRDLSRNPAPINTEQFVITSVQLVYFYDMDDPALSLATPVWMVRGSTPENTAHYVAYLDATR
jgi:hypothetical protein